MKKLSILLMLLCGCSSGLRDVTGLPGDEGEVQVAFRGTKSPGEMGDADMSGFRYLTYDHNLGSWSGEFGGEAVRTGGPQGPFFPADASRVYWPEGKIYSFFAVGYNENVSVEKRDVEFGNSYTMYSSGTSAILTLKNPGHNVDWLAAKAPRQEKINGIPLNFRHVCARVGRLTFDLSAYREWFESRELDIVEIKMLSCTLTDVDEQNYIFSSSAETLFNKESWDYRGSATRALDGERLLGLADNGCSYARNYYAFPGIHVLSMRIQALDSGGNQRIDDRTLSAEVMLPMGADCELNIRVNPYDRDLTIEVATGIAHWQSGGVGSVNE